VNEVVKLHNNSIETIKELGVWDCRLMNCALLGKKQGFLFNSKKAYPVDLIKYAELSGLSGRPKEAYKKALNSAKRLRDTSLDILLPNGCSLYTSIVYEIYYDDRLQSLGIYWNPDFIPLISGEMDKGTFMHPRVDMSGVSSAKRYALYLLLEKNLWRLEQEGSIELAKDEIREVTGAVDGIYVEWKTVTRNYVKPTVKAMYDVLGLSLDISTRKHAVVITKVKGL